MNPSVRRAQDRRCLLAALLAVAVSAGLSLWTSSPVQAQAQAQSDPARTDAASGGSSAGDGLSPAENSAGAKGAKTYCFLRASGNTHQVSWDAAYALIKRQGASLFKTSPEHAAVMITEAVVNNPAAYPDCGKYLGELFAR